MAIVAGTDDAPEEPITEDTDWSPQAQKAAEEHLKCDPFVIQYSPAILAASAGQSKNLSILLTSSILLQSMTPQTPGLHFHWRLIGR